MMTLENISTADHPITNTIFENDSITFVFEDIYDIIHKKYVSNVTVVISNWSLFKANMFVWESTKVCVKKSMTSLEPFDMIQLLEPKANHLKLGGFSSESGHWVEYELEDYDYQILTPHLFPPENL